MKILIISTCKEKLHELEFVKPIEDILKNRISHNKMGRERGKKNSAQEKVEMVRNSNKTPFTTKHFTEKYNPNEFSHIIISGTSLQDNYYLNHLDKFKWIKDTKKPILGICAGMQIIQKIFAPEAELKSKTEIGFYEESFNKELLGIKEGKQQVYHLHNYYFTIQENFEKYTSSPIPQAIKHKTRPLYGVLFHPEVRNKQLITNFLHTNS
jgi:GMP synthase-like glutamine amidotransferase